VVAHTAPQELTRGRRRGEERPVMDSQGCIECPSSIFIQASPPV
jgi:hypothetical protein